MKFKIINYVSALIFLLSSTSILCIPFLNFQEGFPQVAFFLALTFWIGFLVGMVLQIYLWLKTRRLTIKRHMKKPKTALTTVLVLSMISCVFVVCFFQTNMYALPINLCVILLSAEWFCIIKRMERLK